MAANLLELLVYSLPFSGSSDLHTDHFLAAFIYSYFLLCIHYMQVMAPVHRSKGLMLLLCETEGCKGKRQTHLCGNWFMWEIPVIKLPTHWMSLLFHRNSSMEYLSSIEGWQQRPFACSKLKISNCICRNIVHLCSFCNWILYEDSPFYRNKKRELCQTFSSDDSGSADSESWKPANREACSHYTQATCSHYYSLTLQLLEVIST